MKLLRQIVLMVIAWAVCERMHADRAFCVWIGWIVCAVAFEMERNQTWRSTGQP